MRTHQGVIGTDPKSWWSDSILVEQINTGLRVVAERLQIRIIDLGRIFGGLSREKYKLYLDLNHLSWEWLFRAMNFWLNLLSP